MGGKLALVIITFGLMAAGLLSTRQSRLQAAHEVTAARLRIRSHDERLLVLRAEIAEMVTPNAVREMLVASGEHARLAPLAERMHTASDPLNNKTNDEGTLVPVEEHADAS